MTSGLLGARRLRALLEEHGVRPRKALGQNFVVDPNTIRKVVEAARVRPEDVVLEIGAGAGSLTLALAQVAQRVIALEFDRRLIPVLDEVVGGLPNVDVVEGDALRVDVTATGATYAAGNLPYNIAASLVLRVLEEGAGIRGMTVMTQREVGERLAASPGSRVYGQPSVMVAYFATAEVAARVSRRAFFPVPNVDSVVVRVDRRDALPDVPPEQVGRVVRAAFAQRRKTLRNALAPLAGSARTAEEAVRAAGFDPSVRAESVPPEGFVELARSLA